MTSADDAAQATSTGTTKSDESASTARGEKVRALKRMLNDGLITDDEYVARRAQIVDPR